MSFSTLHVATCFLLFSLGRCYGSSDGVSLTMNNPVNVTITNNCCDATNISSEDVAQMKQQLQQITQLLNSLKSSLENGAGDVTLGTNIRDCYEVQQSGITVSGVYTIYPDGTEPFEAYCDMDTDGGGWTVFQRRQDGSVEFYWGWSYYKAGFGLPEAEFWMGNDNLYHLTNQGDYEMRIDMVNTEGVELYMKYDAFRIRNETDEYLLETLGSFTGNTGYDYMVYHAMLPFSTSDNDNDRHSGRCAVAQVGAWWYNACIGANLNGVYGATRNPGIRLYNRGTSAYDHTLSFTEMKIRPAV